MGHHIVDIVGITIDNIWMQTKWLRGAVRCDKSLKASPPKRHHIAGGMDPPPPVPCCNVFLTGPLMVKILALCYKYS